MKKLFSELEKNALGMTKVETEGVRCHSCGNLAVKYDVTTNVKGKQEYAPLCAKCAGV